MSDDPLPICAAADANTPCRPSFVVVKLGINRVKRNLFPTDEVRGGRLLVLIADRTGVATEEVEVDKDRVVRTVGFYIQGQQSEERLGTGNACWRIPGVSKDPSGDRQVVVGAAVEDETARVGNAGLSRSLVCQIGICLDRDRIIAMFPIGRLVLFDLHRAANSPGSSVESPDNASRPERWLLEPARMASRTRDAPARRRGLRTRSCPSVIWLSPNASLANRAPRAKMSSAAADPPRLVRV